ncbi:hypothetical protein L228DRAFT_46650 [Xylona heveae TC161]|uniref:Uncharacterized protein n=1 Tax=Xylona heveae (strain CBS 132557 / TC161) TaxID=1328760 RepID=A0A164ZI50_XYLHT|nr:hypothetical protein L228DRAFT_46650 [Xylona heveae TC161]KZF19125.1 hypothetical protein L228DRAFT_46650 [Xylona heveae TC161]
MSSKGSENPENYLWCPATLDVLKDKTGDATSYTAVKSVRLDPRPLESEKSMTDYHARVSALPLDRIKNRVEMKGQDLKLMKKRGRGIAKGGGTKYLSRIATSCIREARGKCRGSRCHHGQSGEDCLASGVCQVQRGCQIFSLCRQPPSRGGQEIEDGAVHVQRGEEEGSGGAVSRRSLLRSMGRVCKDAEVQRFTESWIETPVSRRPEEPGQAANRGAKRGSPRDREGICRALCL